MKINKLLKSCVLLFIAVIIALSGVTASAENYMGATFKFNYAKRNNSYDISIESNKQNGVAGLDYSILYDASKWRLIKGSYKCSIDGSDTAMEDGVIHTIWETAKSQELPEVLATVSFKKIANDADISQIVLSVNEYYDDGIPPKDLDFQVEYTEKDKINLLSGTFNWGVFIAILALAVIGGAGYYFVGVKGYFRPEKSKH